MELCDHKQILSIYRVTSTNKKHLCIFGPKGAIQIRYYYYYYCGALFLLLSVFLISPLHHTALYHRRLIQDLFTGLMGSSILVSKLSLFRHNLQSLPRIDSMEYQRLVNESLCRLNFEVLASAAD